MDDSELAQIRARRMVRSLDTATCHGSVMYIPRSHFNCPCMYAHAILVIHSGRAPSPQSCLWIRQRHRRLWRPSGRHGWRPGQCPWRRQGRRGEKAEEMRKTMLMSILDTEARERLARIAIVKPANARAVEDMVIRMAQTGQLRGKVPRTT
ncbi:PDCD5-related protein [Catenaria anguillulae PL171]|uniref:PDCD5-related protein n=1 Tax=Catenaria anguillulae PL171 TaxID=765915 RepID=A0A1Y2HRV1_9FUNG|nr:PDCD5-related protein [Catenaria anguillulae PL171]